MVPQFQGSCRSLLQRVVACALGAAAMPTLPDWVSAQSLVFSDQTAAAGLTFTHNFDPAAPNQFMAGGCGAIDYNRDGWQDLFVFGGLNNPDRLYRNNGDGTFTDVAAAAGVNRNQRGRALAIGDFDANGYLDLYLAVEPGLPAYSPNSLFRNNGDGTFTDVAGAWGVANHQGTNSGGGWGGAFGDYNLDGRLDLAVAEWLSPTSIRNRLYRNTGTAFTNATNTALIGTTLLGVRGFSPRFCDMNGDRYPELLWVGDFGTSKYFVNNKNGTFSDATLASGTGKDRNGMGNAVGDINNDGKPDWFVTAIFIEDDMANPGNTLYLNQGAHVFTEVAAARGVDRGGWGWGAVAVDLNNDGWIDLANTNGYQYETIFVSDPSVVFMNDGTTFSQVAPTCGISHTDQGRGMVNFDYDNDGDQDLVISSCGQPLVLYRNDTASANNWLRLFFSTRGTPTNAPDGIGARVVVTTGATSRYAWITAGTNYVSQSELSAHFGVGAASVIDTLRVEWPNGTFREWTGVAPNRTLLIKSKPTDFDDDGLVGVADLFGFLDAWFATSLPADFDLSGAATVVDLFDYLDEWFASVD